MNEHWCKYDHLHVAGKAFSTMEEGLDHLKSLWVMEMKIEGGVSCLRVPNPDPQALLQALGIDISLPPVRPKSIPRVVDIKKTRRKRHK